MGRETPSGETTREDEQTPPAEALAQIRYILWREDEPDRSWNGGDELESIAAIMTEAGFGPPDGPTPRMQAFTVPAAFLVEGLDADDAALRLSLILHNAKIVQGQKTFEPG